ncbi:UbiH/UbiF family hydroxylase [Candidatus Accumulibacter phosphatis]|jgi:2-octaprenylphenol hydroxylase|uniref:UbiH/UbiF family hydroxylase n=1 Tax=Candidatus Accumulibacter phosphatis TaxID=327160 RepID=A0ABX1TYM0_9PROT|nr:MULTISPECIES: UbiH/UbiF family hydroxylase [Candidatus Accumulibacter]NMQ27768.1 UbiH/UbiF family hydroxylase [Candidatus Accumulibacter phosphatis]
MQVSAFDVLIVGGGLAGLSLACALRDTRLRLGLVEQRPPQRPAGWDARVYAVSPANAAFLREIGAWKHMAVERIAPLHAMQIFGDGDAELDFSAYETGIPELGWILESSLMACELWENAKRQGNLSLCCPAAPQSLAITSEASVLTLSNGDTLSAKLLVGADGRDSWVREALELPAINTAYGEMGLVANFECGRPHGGIARQWFRADGVLAWLPLPGNRISIVWSTPDENARRLLAMSAEDLCARVAAAGSHQLGALQLLTPPAAFPLRLMQVPRIVAPRLALVGDAAHGIHPLSGHGINLGYQDAKVLARLLAGTPDWKDIGNERLLLRYQRERREETLLMQTTTHALHKLFHDDFPGLRPLRNLGMNLANALPVLKNSLVRYAIGAF